MSASLGRHLIADIGSAHNLADPDAIAASLAAAASAARLTLLAVHVHHFGAGQGVTGVALLAKSHISIHTWPETGTYALDVFACGAHADPAAALAAMLERHGGRVLRQQVIARLAE